MSNIIIARHTAFFDVDDTLIKWINNTDPDAETAIPIEDVLVRPIQSHVEALKKHKERGDTVIVWTQGGEDWAKKVVSALGLEDYVDYCLSKPTVYYDDLHCDVWLKHRIYKPYGDLDLPPESYWDM